MTFNPTSHATLSHARTYTSRLLLCWLVVFLAALFSCIPRSAAETMDEYPPELVALAAELGHDPVRIFRWVHDNIEFEDYFRARKGALATLRTRRGNQWDQSWLLVELLRISGVPARYAYTGFNNNVYVEASLDEAHYKGFADSGEKRWIPLVPWIKETTGAPSLDLFPSEDGSIAADTLLFSLDDYLADPTNKSALEVYEERLQNYLIVHHPGKTLKDIVFSERITPFPSSLLPCELPDDWRVDGGPARFDEIPSRFRACVGITVSETPDGVVVGDKLLSATVSLPSCSGQILTLEFTAASGQTTPAVSVGGIDCTPDEPPQSLATDDYFIAEIDFGHGGSQTLPAMKAGTLVVMSLDCLSASPQRVEELKRELLSDGPLDNTTILRRQGALLGASYMLRLQHAIARVDALLHTRRFYREPGFFAGFYLSPEGQTAASAFTDTDGLSAFGALPAWRIDAFWKMDGGGCYKAPARRLCGGLPNTIPVRSELGGLSCDLAMFTASYNEGLVFEDWLDTPGLSTIGGLMAAKSDGIDIATVTVTMDGGVAKIRYRTDSGQDQLLTKQAFLDLLAAQTDPLQTAGDIVSELTTLTTTVSEAEDAEQVTLTVTLGDSTINYKTSEVEDDVTEPQLRQRLLAQPEAWPESRIDEILAGLWSNQIVFPVAKVGYDDEIPGDGELKAEVRLSRLFEFDRYLYAQDGTTTNGGGTFSWLFDPIGEFFSGVVSAADTFLGEIVDFFTTDLPENLSSAWDALGDFAGKVWIQGGKITDAIRTTVGDPVNPVTGEFYAEELSDLSVRAPGMELGVTRTYRSKLDYHGPFGEGWAWNHSELLLEWEDGNLLFCDADQTLHDITVTAETPPTYSYPPGTTFRIKARTDGGHVIMQKDQTRLYFGNEGYLEKKEDANGNKLDFGYNDDEQLVTITDTLSRSIYLTYNGIGKVEKAAAPGEQVCFYIYGGSDLASIEAQMSSQTTKNLDAALIRAVGSGTASAALPLLGAEDDLVAFVDVAGNVTVYSYLQNQDNPHCNHNMSQYWLPNGDYLKIGYYENDTVSQHENAKHEIFSFQYSFLNRYAETWNESGYYRKVFWNENHDVTRITAEDETIELMEFDDSHNVTAKTDGNGNRTEYTYDEWRNITSATLHLDNGETATTSYTYNYDGVNPSLVRQIVVVDPEHQGDPAFPGTVLDFDASGNLLTRTDPPVDGVQHRLRQEYDGYGNVTATIDEQSTDGMTWIELQRADAVYDPAWPVLPGTVTDAYNTDTVFTYDGTGATDRIGRIIAATDAAGNTAQMQYNPYGQVTQLTDPLLNVTQKLYDENRRLLMTTAPSGAITANIYDVSRDIVSGAKLAETVDPFGHSQHFTYDAVGNAVSKTDPNGNVSTFQYDGIGRPTASIDALGNTVYLAYDGNGNVTRKTDARGNSTFYTYDAANRKTSVTDPNGNTTTYEYDLNGNLLLLTAADGVVTKFVCDGLNRLRKKIVNYDETYADDQQPNARIWTVQYDALGRKTRTTDPEQNYIEIEYDRDDPNLVEHNLVKSVFDYCDTGPDLLLSETITEYNSRGLVARVTDGNGNATVLEYDELRRKSAETAPNGTRTEYQYDEVGNLTCIQVRDSFDALLSETRYNYNLRGERVATTRVLLDENGDETGVVTQGFGYDTNGNLTSVADEDGNTSWIYYDAANRRIATADAEGHTTLFDLDENGNMVAIVDPINNMVSSEYDEDNRVISTTDATGNEVTYSYDAMGRVVTKTKHDPTPDGVNIITQYTYTAFGQPQVVTEAVGTPDEASTSYTYTGTGQVATATDPRGNAVTFEYDGAGHRTVAVDADLSRREFFYDANGNLTYEKRRDDTWIARVFDNVNRLTDVHLLASSTDPLDVTNRQQQFTYDVLSRMLTATDHNGGAATHMVTYEYDSLSRAVGETQDTYDVLNTYDHHSNLTQLTYPGGAVADTVFDTANRATGIDYTPPGGVRALAASYERDDAGQITAALLGNGMTMARTLSPNGQELTRSYVQNVTELASAIMGDPGNPLAAAYDFCGNLTQQTIGLAGHAQAIVKAYDYDALSRLTGEDSAGVPACDFKHTFAYDLNGNWTDTNQNGMPETRTANADNEYTAINGFTPVYDANGNLLQSDEWTTYTYDWANRLVAVDIAAGGPMFPAAVTYTYDALNRRVTKTVDGTTTRCVYSGNQVIEERVAGVLDKTYVLGPGIDSPVLLDDGTDLYYYLRDRQNTVIGLADAAGAIVETYTYTAFGIMTVYDASGSPIVSQQSAIGNPYGFTGRRWDAESALWHYRNRMYSARLGRFLQRDPAGYVDGTNLSAYVRNNPVLFTDPNGLMARKTWKVGTTVLETALNVATSPIQLSTNLLDWLGVKDLSTPREETEILLGKFGLTYEQGMQLKTDSYLNEDEAQTLDFCERIETFHTKSGYDAVVYRLDNGTTVIFNRGTEQKSLKDWLTDFGQGLGLEMRQYWDAVEFAASYQGKTDGILIVAGHSLGGGEAAAQVSVLGLPGFTFNPAGLHPRVMEGLGGSASNLKQISNIINPGEILNTLQYIVPGMPNAAGNDNYYVMPGFLDGIFFTNPIKLHSGISQLDEE